MMENDREKKTHITIITAKRPWYDLRLKEVWQYRDLIILFTERSFQISFKQTILGPLWLFLNPFITSIFFTVVFGQIAGIQTAGIPGLLYYLVSNGIWGFFASCVYGTANIFNWNAYLFGKVYFPRLTVPISQIIASVIRFLIQMSMVLVVLAYYCIKRQVFPHWSAWLLIPLILLELGLMGMGVGIIFSSMTTKYKDLASLVGFGMNLWMYATPIIYPITQVPLGWLRSIALVNPVTPMVELFRYVVLGAGEILPGTCIWSMAFTLLLAFVGLLLFNRVERTFTDTV